MRPLLRRMGSVAELLGHYMESGRVPPDLCPLPELGPLSPDDGVPVITVGRTVPLRVNRAVTSVGLPGDIASRMDRLLSAGLFDVVHVHEPAAPSLSFGALRLARNPVVATFHLTPLGLLAYEWGRPILQRFYPQIDRRVVFTDQASATMHDFFGGDYQVIPPRTLLGSASALASGCESPAYSPATVAAFLYLYRGDERRSLRLLLRALRAGSLPRGSRLLIGVHGPSAAAWPLRSIPRALSGRVEVRPFNNLPQLAALYAGAHTLVLPFLGGEWLSEACAEAAEAGVSVVAPEIPVLRDLLGEGAFFFSPDREETLSAALEGALIAPRIARRPGATLRQEAHMDRVLTEYRVAAASRQPRATTVTRPVAAAKGMRPVRDAAGRILADLHVHTSYSADSASPVEAVLATAREVGLGALAIADHNTIRGALKARELAGDLIIIVAEEIKTLQGEVMGLFLEDEIPAGLTFEETLSRIKGQGGLVCIPHPFDGLHTTPSYRSLADNAHRIDIVEAFNARLAFDHFNVRAERFAAKYNMVAGAGSDAHVLQGIGTAMVSMRQFVGPEDFMESLREADILANRKSVVYLTALKRLQTTLDRVLPRA